MWEENSPGTPIYTSCEETSKKSNDSTSPIMARIERYLECPGYRPSSQISTGEKDELKEDP
jgi:hypothetical protein